MPPETTVWAYPLTLFTHISLVLSSVSLFTARGLGVLTGQNWPMGSGWRRLSVWIDIGLLSAGSTLWYIAQFNPLHHHWLGAKLIWLLVYILLGSYALKRAPTRSAKAAFFAAALLCIAFMASIALHHNPLGWWST
ncbi:MAG: SirB2 family protein [Hydrogenophaga sp.]